MKMLTLFFVLVFCIVMVGGALAVPPGKNVEFAGGGAGKVLFDGKTHADKGLKCQDCHTKIFQMKKGTAKIKMADINSGKLCGECHNGTKAFKAGDPANCSKCHKK